MSIDSFKVLQAAVIGASDATGWSAAVAEWSVAALEEDPTGRGMCACGQQHLVKLFTIRNDRNGNELFPIGSVCINLFGRADLDRETSLLGDLFILRTAVLSRTPVSLDGKFFSRAMLGYFLDSGVFTPDQWNDHDGWGDYEFLLKMFNKRNKDDISRPQRLKIRALLQRKVFPFVEADPRLN